MRLNDKWEYRLGWVVIIAFWVFIAWLYGAIEWGF
jgi:hypothetical protein